MTIRARGKKVLAISLVVILSVSLYALARTEVGLSDTNKKLEAITKQLQETQGRIKEVTHNPNSLNECLNTAALNYASAIKKDGTTSVVDNKTSYSLTEKDWGKINADYEAEKQNCQGLFGE